MSESFGVPKGPTERVRPMLRQALFIVGEPGSGRSSLVEELTLHCPGSYLRNPVPHSRWNAQGGVVWGLVNQRPGSFRLTDVRDWLDYQDYRGPGPLLLAEGDALTNDRFVEALQDGGWEFTLAYLDVSPDVLEERQVGYTPYHCEVYALKVRNLLNRWDSHVLPLDGDLPTHELANRLADINVVASILMEGLETQDGDTQDGVEA